MTEKKDVHLRLEPEFVDWVDKKIEESVWADRCHAFRRMVVMAQARDARGEDLTEIEFPGDRLNIELELSTEAIERAKEDAKKLGISLGEFFDKCIEFAKDSGKFD